MYPCISSVFQRNNNYIKVRNGQWLGRLAWELPLLRLDPYWYLSLRAKSLKGKPNTPFTRYNRLSIRLYNRYDNRLYRVNGA